MPPPVSLHETVHRFYDELIRAARLSVRSWPAPDPATSHEDLAQEAVLRLITRAPPEWQPQAPALAVLVAWVKRCCWRMCCDASRREERRGPRARLDGSRARAPRWASSSPRVPSPLEQLVAERQAAAALRVLRERYPRGAELLEVVLTEPDATVPELAERLGTSSANVHQIRSRARRVLIDAGFGAA